MTCIIPQVNLVRNIGFDNQATHTVESDFADLEMHAVCPMKFPLKTPTTFQANIILDNVVFRSHYKRLESRRNLWQKASERLKKLFSSIRTGKIFLGNTLSGRRGSTKKGPIHCLPGNDGQAVNEYKSEAPCTEMKPKSFFPNGKAIWTFEELRDSKESVIAYREKLGHREGAGSLFQDIISAQILCNLAGKVLACPRIRYLHHHKSNGDTLEEYVNKWDRVFASLDLYHHRKEFSEELPFIENPKATLDSLGSELFEVGLKDLRSRFQTRNRNLPGSAVEIAVHLRNGNSEDEIRGPQAVDYALFNETFNPQLNPKSNLSRLMRVQRFLIQEKDWLFENAQTLRMTIISQGVLPGIESLEKLMPIEYYLDEHPVLSFERMLKSDLLIIGQSSFSYLASLVRRKRSLTLHRFRHRLPANCLIAEIF
jgi:hypothetical protein